MSIPLRAKKHLYDILEALDAIHSFTEGMGENEFLNDALVQAAVERKFEIG